MLTDQKLWKKGERLYSYSAKKVMKAVSNIKNNNKTLKQLNIYNNKNKANTVPVSHKMITILFN